MTLTDTLCTIRRSLHRIHTGRLCPHYTHALVVCCCCLPACLFAWLADWPAADHKHEQNFFCQMQLQFGKRVSPVGFMQQRQQASNTKTYTNRTGTRSQFTHTHTHTEYGVCSGSFVQSKNWNSIWVLRGFCALWHGTYTQYRAAYMHLHNVIQLRIGSGACLLYYINITIRIQIRYV